MGPDDRRCTADVSPMRLDVRPDLLHADVTDASPTSPRSTGKAAGQLLSLSTQRGPLVSLYHERRRAACTAPRAPR
eukprot:7514327-Pyramimonas_sp.AAC.1